MGAYSLYGGNLTLEFNGGSSRTRYVGNGEPIPGVTTINKIMYSWPLENWKLKSITEYIEGVWEPGVAYDEVQISQILAEAQEARNSKKAVSIGGVAHDKVEQYVKSIMRGRPIGRLKSLPVHKEARAAVEAYFAWEDDHDVEYFFSERKTASMEHWFAGTTDLVMSVDGIIGAWDLKTSSGIFDNYFLQGAAYAGALMEEHDVDPFLPGPIEEIGVIRIPKDGGKPDYKTTDDLDLHYKGFLGGRELFRWSKLARKDINTKSKIRKKIQKEKEAA